MANASTAGSSKWILQMEEALRRAAVGCVLTFNIYDYVVTTETPPSRLRIFLARFFRRLDFEIVVFFSRAHGCELWLEGMDEEAARQTIDRFERYSGLRLQWERAPDGEGENRYTGAADLRDSLLALTRLLRQKLVRTMVVVEYAHFLAPATQGLAFASAEQILAVETLHRWSLDEAIRTAGNRVILLGDEGRINELLLSQGSGFQLVTVDLPDVDTRREFITQIEKLAAAGRQDLGRLEPEITSNQAAQLTAGLPLADVERLFRSAGARGEPLTRHAIREAKAEVIRSLGRDLIEVFEPSYGFEAVAGLNHVVEYLNEITNLLHMSSRTVPRAVLFVGVPGVGKTFIVKAWARELGWNCLAMRAIRSKWVGESERNLERVLNIIRNLQPCLLFTDEVDAVVGRRGNPQADSGVSARIFARLLEFTSMEEHRGKVLWVGATNRPDLLDPAIVDRFGVILPFLPPTPSQLPELFQTLAKQLGRKLAHDVNLNELSGMERVRSVSARGLLEVVSQAANWTDSECGEPDSPIKHDHLRAAIADHLTDFDPLEHEFIALTALRLTSFSFHLPWRTRSGNRLGYDLPPYLAALVDEKTGELDQDAVDRRLKQLAHELTGSGM